MHLSLLSRLLWAAGFSCDVALLFVLLYKRRDRIVPFFTLWTAFGVVDTIGRYFAYRFGTKRLYADVFWGAELLDLVLQVSVIYEIARSALKPGRSWIEGAKIRLGIIGVAAPGIAFIMACFMTPAAENRLDAWDARANLFLSVLICLLFSGVVSATQQLGLLWRSHVMRESYGLILWTLISFATDTLHAYWRTLSHFTVLEYVRALTFQIVSIYWAVIFWFPEPEPASLSAETIDSLNALTRRLE